MSEGFNPYQPQASGQGRGLRPGERPVVATVFGILNLVFGILGICSGAMVAAGFTFLFNVLDAKTKAQMNLDESMRQFNDPVFFGFFVTQMTMGAILSVVIIISGIGLLKFKNWGRKLANFYAIANLILLVVGIVINIVFTVIPAVNAANLPGASPNQVTEATMGVVGGVFGACFGAIYPICILVFLNRRQFVEQIKDR